MESNHSHHKSTINLKKVAFMATTHCLTGCAIGEIGGMVLGSLFGWAAFTTVVVSILLSFFFGYSLTLLPLLRSSLNLHKALPIAFASDTISITSMEIIDNLIVLVIPGAISAPLSSLLFWGSLMFSLAIAFSVTFPVNMYLISRGKGHAVMHEFHS